MQVPGVVGLAAPNNFSFISTRIAVTWMRPGALRFWLTTSAYWSMQGVKGRDSLGVCTTSFTLAVLCGALCVGIGLADATERKGAAKPAPAADEFPAATDIRLGGDDKETRFV